MRILITLIVIATATIAAPIPKSLKARRAFDITGMWQLVEHNSDGKPRTTDGMIRFWKFTDDSFEYYKDENTKHDNVPRKLITPDSDRPQSKLMGGSLCYFERDGSRMVWVYGNGSVQLENSEPGPNRNQYVFELVK